MEYPARLEECVSNVRCILLHVEFVILLFMRRKISVCSSGSFLEKSSISKSLERTVGNRWIPGCSDTKCWTTQYLIFMMENNMTSILCTGYTRPFCLSIHHMLHWMKSLRTEDFPEIDHALISCKYLLSVCTVFSSCLLVRAWKIRFSFCDVYCDIRRLIFERFFRSIVRISPVIIAVICKTRSSSIQPIFFLVFRRTSVKMY